MNTSFGYFVCDSFYLEIVGKTFHWVLKFGKYSEFTVVAEYIKFNGYLFKDE